MTEKIDKIIKLLIIVSDDYWEAYEETNNIKYFDNRKIINHIILILRNLK